MIENIQQQNKHRSSSMLDNIRGKALKFVAQQTMNQPVPFLNECNAPEKTLSLLSITPLNS